MAVMQGEPSVLVRLAAIEAALATRSGLVRHRLATGGSLALILEQWLLWAQRWVLLKPRAARAAVTPVVGACVKGRCWLCRSRESSITSTSCFACQLCEGSSSGSDRIAASWHLQ